MAGPHDALRSGAWVTRERMRLVAGLVLAFGMIAAVFLVATSDGLNDRFGRPLGTDFSNVYAAGTYMLDGAPAAPFDPPRQYAREQAIFGAATPFFGWHYPPFFLGVAALLALMPYGLALAVWQSVTFALYLLAVRTVLTMSVPSPLWGEGQGEGDWTCRLGPPHPAAQSAADLSPSGRGETHLWVLLAAAYPAVFVNLGHGHNGFLTAALIAAALVQLDRRPVLAGVLFACLAYKPQFGVLIPLVLAASGRWRTFTAATITVLAMAAAVTVALGLQVWTAFFASMHFTRVVVLEQGETGWQKIQSVFAVVRMWGGSVQLAYAVQGAATLAVAVALIGLWRSRAAFPLKAAALVIGCILATPYSLDYDLMLVAPVIAWLAADGFTRGFMPYEKTALAFLWIVPLIARSVALATLIPLAVPAMIFAFVLILHRAMNETGAAPGRWRFARRALK
ncbi:MAG TPA: glycosyltransferase family 87 protein [Pseudolabrys sp.]|nr:glycosyltransferase family 87 protein [Pseudolabrys sp.]